MLEKGYVNALCGVGLVMGGVQSLSRSTYAKFLPETKDHEIVTLDSCNGDDHSFDRLESIFQYMAISIYQYIRGLLYQHTDFLLGTLTIYFIFVDDRQKTASYASHNWIAVFF